MLYKKMYIASMLALCNILFIGAMDTPARQAHVFVVVLDDNHVICLHDTQRSEQLQLPGGIISSNQSPIEAARVHLEQQTGIRIATGLLDFIGEATRFDGHKQKLLGQYYFLVDNQRLKPSKEDSDELYTIRKSVDELAEGKAYFPRDHSQSSLQVGIVLQKIAQYIKTGCKAWDMQDMQEFVEDKNSQDNKTQLELFPKKN
jgi:ADP-ribose pyrophosphatase YjhB (NUDIX family)